LQQAVFVFGLLVLVHELGHFATAKLTGMRVDEFAIGFGPKLVSFVHGETTYSLRAVPLGGFNDIAGMDPSDNEAGDRGYCEKSVGARMIVIPGWFSHELSSCRCSCSSGSSSLPG
jgi:regulator of sigma E protease